MTQQFRFLFSSYRIQGVELKNRIVFLPHFTGFATNNGIPTDTHVHYYAERAKGGVGLMIMEGQAAHPTGKMSPRFIEAYDKKVIPGYQKVTEEVHRYETKIFAQVNHGGHTTLTYPPQLLWAPSQMPEPCCSYNTKEMDLEDINAVIEGFALAAKHIKMGGFDGIEIKAAAHDGLLRSFVSPYFNRRTDQYGGSFENRMRLPLEVIDAIRQTVGPDFPFGVRVCLDEFTPWGYSLDYGKKIVERFAATGKVDYINSDAGTFSSFFMEIPPTAVPLGFAVYLSAAVKEITNLPVIAFGRINDPVQAEQILSEGHADLIGMARELICDPEFPQKAYEGRVDDIRHCIACQDGCCYQVMQDKSLRCIQNPAAGREKQYGMGTIKPASPKKNVAVIGGGPAGLKVAELVALRGHRVTLFEKDTRLGGQVLIAAKIPHREEVEEVVRHLIIKIKNLGVKIHLGEEANPESIKRMHPDVVVVATGSYPFVPPMPGVKDENVATVWDVLLERKKVGEKVVVVDKDRHWQGLGTAEFLTDRGKEVEIITPGFFVGENLEPSNVVTSYQRLFEKGVTLTPHTDIKEMLDHVVVTLNVYTMQEKRIEDVDTVVFACGNRSNNKLHLSLKGKVKALHSVGDCVAPRRIEQAIYEANHIGRLI